MQVEAAPLASPALNDGQTAKKEVDGNETVKVEAAPLRKEDAALKSSGQIRRSLKTKQREIETTCGTGARKGFIQQVKEVSEFVPLSPGRRDLDSKYTLESLILAQNERWRRA